MSINRIDEKQALLINRLSHIPMFAKGWMDRIEEHLDNGNLREAYDCAKMVERMMCWTKSDIIELRDLLKIRETKRNQGR